MKRISYIAVLCVLAISLNDEARAEEDTFNQKSVKDKSAVQSELVALFQQEVGNGKSAGNNGWHLNGFQGVANCARCHRAAASVDDPLLGAFSMDGFIHYGEYPIWSSRDKHVQAYAVLLNARSKRMGEILGTDVSKDQRCIACHAGTPISMLASDDKGLISAENVGNRDVALGVTCEGCHGGSGGVDGYLLPHSITPPANGQLTGKEWRYLSPADKAAKGFNDVRSPAARARICASCHVGEASMGRVVTHEMYAAGHPPLPGFEVETFIDQMPRHWRFIDEKDPKVLEAFVANSKDELYKSDHFDVKSLVRSRSMLISSIVVLSQNVKLMADLAAGDVSDDLKIKPEWPELAQFDCFACHHDLQYPGWRQTRKPIGVPGRPTMREWPMAIPRVAIKVAGLDEAAFTNALNDVLNASVDRPFGNAEAIKSSATKFTAWADEAAEKLSRTIISRDKGKAILAAIAETCTSETLDYDSARQLAWAFMIVEREMNGKVITSINLKESLGDAAKIGNPLRGYDSNDPVLKALEPLDYDPTAEGTMGLLLLNLRKGKQETQKLPINVNLPTTEVDLLKSMPPVGNYDPDKFKAVFAEIAAWLEKL